MSSSAISTDDKQQKNPGNNSPQEPNPEQKKINFLEENIGKINKFLESHRPKENVPNDGSNRPSQLERLRKNLNQIKEALNKLMKFEEDHLDKEITDHLNILPTFLAGLNKAASPSAGSLVLTEKDESDLQEINKNLKKLQFHIPSVSKLSSKGTSAHRNLKASIESSARSEAHKLLNPHQSQTEFQNSSFYKEIANFFEGLKDEKKEFCLSCFCVLPENEVVKRRVLTYWLIGEGFLEASVIGDRTPAEKIVDGFLEEFKEQGLIEPANGKRGRHTKSYRMHPLVRSAVIMLSQKNHFFEYDSMGNLTEKLSESSRACLIKSEEGSSSKQKQQASTNKTNLVPEKVETLFNVSDTFPDAHLVVKSDNNVNVVVECLLKMKKVKVLYLGRWQKSALKHIEVESFEFLGGLKGMKDLKLLSLQGISRIDKIPSSIGYLKNLLILDLKACHNLAELPKGITSLNSLIYMDVSDCYLLEHMPKKLSSLSNLQVLKGFVIGNRQNKRWGTLDDLKALTKLRKLTINASSHEFPAEKDLNALCNLEALQKLTIAWGAKQGNGEAKPAAISPKQGNGKEKPAGIPSKQGKTKLEKLVKLDLLCFPKSQPPGWLNPDKLEKVKQLYIRGGRLQTLGNHKWEVVDTLCLKFLSEFKMNWRQLRENFPHMVYLEKVRCPRITFCPCDENGVWLNDEQTAEKPSQQNNIVN